MVVLLHGILDIFVHIFLSVSLRKVHDKSVPVSLRQQGYERETVSQPK